VAIASVDLEGRVLDVNRALLQASGYTVEDLRGRPFSAFIEPGGDDARGRFVALTRGELDSYRVERKVRTRSGELRDVELSVSLVRGSDGRPSICLAVLQDLTTHRRALANEAHRAAELLAVIDSIPAAVYIGGADGITIANRVAAEQLGFAAVGDVRCDISILSGQLQNRFAATGERVPPGQEPFARALRGERVDTEIVSRHLLTGQDVVERVIAAPIRIADTIVGAIAVNINITDRKETEEALRLSNELLQLVVQQSSEAIVVADESGVVRIFNRAAERLYGVHGAPTAPEEWTAHYRLRRLDGSALPFQESALYRAVRGQRVNEARWLVDRPDGTRRTLVGGSAPLRRADGTPAGGVLIARDDTDRLAAEQERERLLVEARRAHQEIETTNRIKDEFLATLSHELRTPLNAILGWARILRSRASDDAAHRALDVIERNARAQARLIDDLLDVSRIITGKIRVQVEPIDLAVLAASALESVKPAADAKGVTLETKLPPAPPRLSGDPQRLQQILWNLLSNAVKFTESGGRVTLEMAGETRRLRITVSDTGIGIAPAMLPYVFDRFTQGDSSSTRHHTGLGLGLAIVRHLAELHGGTVAAESAGEGKGATFHVWLPVQG